MLPIALMVASQRSLGSTVIRHMVQRSKQQFFAARSPQRMPNHMTTLGFAASAEQDVAQLAMIAARQGQPLPGNGGTYYRWSPGAGIELWAQADPDGRIIGLNPHFAGVARMRVGLIERIAREGDSA